MTVNIAELQAKTARDNAHFSFSRNNQRVCAHIPNESKMSADEIRRMIKDARKDISSGKTYTTKEVVQSLEAEFGITI